MDIFLGILGFFIALFGVSQGIVLLVNYFSFTKPFSLKMVKYQVYDYSVHNQLTKVELVSCIITLIISVMLIAVVLIFGEIITYILSGVGFAIGLIYSLIINKAAVGYTYFNVDCFVSKHQICMDMDKYNENKFFFLRKSSVLRHISFVPLSSKHTFSVIFAFR